MMSAVALVFLVISSLTLGGRTAAGFVSGDHGPGGRPSVDVLVAPPW